MMTERSEMSNLRSKSNIYTESIAAIQDYHQKHRSPRLILRSLKSNKSKLIETNKFIEAKRPSAPIRSQILPQLPSRISISDIKQMDEIEKERTKSQLVRYILKNYSNKNHKIKPMYDYEKKAPFRLESYRYMEKILPEKQRVADLGLDHINFNSNKMILEKIMLRKILNF